jgi:hypothetical protein
MIPFLFWGATGPQDLRETFSANYMMGCNEPSFTSTLTLCAWPAWHRTLPYCSIVRALGLAYLGWQTKLALNETAKR